MDSRPTIGLGCMRLSTAPDRDTGRGVEVIRAALDAGVTLLDTARSYALDEDDAGHNERLVAEALTGWTSGRVRVITKGGMRRPDGAWVPDGRARTIRDGAARSVEALGGRVPDLLLLHAPDPRTKLSTSARALARVQGDGLARSVGLSNVTVAQIEEARRHMSVAAVQVECGPRADRAERGGVLAYCLAEDIEVIAHRPLGGPEGVRRLARDRVVTSLAADLGVSPPALVLSWLRARGVSPIPGATRVETARDLASALALEPGAEVVESLDAHFRERTNRRPAPAHGDGEVVLLVGSPAAGKSSLAASHVERGYERLNRDEAGGRLADLLPRLDELLAAGHRRIVMDNTYPDRASRADVIGVAARHGVPVRCLWLDTDPTDAQINAVRRMLERHRALPMPEEIRAARGDPAMFGPNALFGYGRKLEPPVVEEGFASVEEHRFERTWPPTFRRAGCFVDLADVVESTAPRDPLTVREDRADRIRDLATSGTAVVILSWQPGVAEGAHTSDDVERMLDELERALGVDVRTAFCPHGGGPPVCWCRKPMPGLAVRFVEELELDPAATTIVARSAADRTLGKRMGFRVLDETFWG